jgi:hypothetical protein
LLDRDEDRGRFVRRAATISCQKEMRHMTMDAQRHPVQRIVHIARIRAGSEAELRRLAAEPVPTDVLAEAGVEELTLFVGSAYAVTAYAFRGEYTPTFTAVRRNPAFAAFLEALGSHLDDTPAPHPDTPAEQTLASQALHWDAASGVSSTPVVRPKAASTDRV